MTDDVRNLIRFVVDGDIRNAQTQCRIMLEKNVPEKDAVVSMVGSAKDLLTFLQSAGTTRHF